jgi:hypothetical protein
MPRAVTSTVLAMVSDTTTASARAEVRIEICLELCLRNSCGWSCFNCCGLSDDYYKAASDED